MAHDIGGSVGSVGRIAGQAVDVVGDVVGDVVDLSVLRSSAALDALRGGPVRPPVGVRRLPWAIAAAVVGAAAGAAAAVLVRRVLGQDAPDAQAPEDLEAVVDRPDLGV
jgi:hypothetical protein